MWSSVMTNDRRPVNPDTQAELSQAELEAQEAAELPEREAMSLVNPALLTTDPSTLTAAGGTGAEAGGLAGQSADDASQLASSSAADAAGAQDPSQSYQPNVTSVARS
jgi:hypothetical protein